ncbi:MAG: FAD-dependent oxidoreductase [Deltaproteobacteria bacterium]|nr:FAD-dependent oxidoreductase [Deltaproteobacteria bacterium]
MSSPFDPSGWAEAREEAVLIGGGLLGLETGNALRKLGKKVTVVEFFSRLLPRQLDENGAKRLQGIMEEMGFSFRLGARTEGITGETRVNGVRLEGSCRPLGTHDGQGCQGGRAAPDQRSGGLRGRRCGRIQRNSLRDLARGPGTGKNRRHQHGGRGGPL